VTEVGVPKIGVTSVGLVAKTMLPVPVDVVSAVRRLAEDGVARNVATPVASPDTPVLIGRPVALVSVTDVGVPRIGVTNVGLVAKTSPPLPVSSVIAAARLADEGVARKVPTPVPRPETPPTGTAVAVIVPLPVAAIEAPVPTTIAEVVFVLPVIALNAVDPPLALVPQENASVDWV
jgi:hypothetical protein